MGQNLMLANDYREIVKDVYLRPIRSVLVVDDEYPALQSILSYNGSAENFANSLPWYGNRSEINRVLESLRVRDRKKRILDVCDNLDFLDEGDDVVGHLHQCDLLVLDYEINDNGEKAIKALSRVLNNNQFNLVVVHSSHDINHIFDTILLPLLGKSQMELSDDENTEIEEVEALIAGIRGASERLTAAIDFGIYKFIRKSSSMTSRARLSRPELSGITAMFEEFGLEPDKWESCLKFAITKFEEKNDIAFSACPKASSELSWNDVGNHWIACPEGFISFATKAADLDIEVNLLDALTNWKPTPTQLLFSDIRNRIDDAGIIAEISSKDKVYAHAKWYSDLLLENGQGRKQVSNSTLHKYFEIIEMTIQNQTSEFIDEFCLKDWKAEDEARHMTELCNAQTKNAKGRIVIKKKKAVYSLVNDFYNVDIGEPSQKEFSDLQHNIFVSNKSPSILHLELGHIFEADSAHWICLTPACDMIPERNKGLHKGDLNQHKPFVAVKLQKVSRDDLEKSKIQSNRFIFTDFGNFCFNEPKDEDSAPHWFPLYAQNHGILDERKFTYNKLNTGAGGSLVFQEFEGTIKTQLRYEYAINLMSRLAANMQRVGLDYSGE